MAETAGQRFIRRYAKGKVTTPEGKKEVFKEIVRRAGGRPVSGGVSRADISEKEKRRAEEAARQRKAEAAKIEAMRQAGLKKLAEDKKRAEELDKKAREEYKKILDARANLIKRGIQEQIIRSRDARTNEQLEITRWRDRQGNRVERIKNLVTGDTSYSSHARPSRGGNVRQTGKVVLGATQKRRNTLEDIQKLQKQLLLGEKLIYDNKTMKIIGIESSRLGQSIPYTEKGIEFYNRQISKTVPKFDFKKFLKESAAMAALGKQSIIKEEKGKFLKGFQKVAVSRKFQTKEVRAEQEKKEKKWKDILNKMSKGEKLNQTDIKNYKEITDKAFTPEALIDKDVAKFAQITGQVVGTFVHPIPGAIMWAMGDNMESVRKSVGDGKKITKQDFGKLVFTSAIKGAIMGVGMKVFGSAANIAGKRILTGAALRTAENNAIRAALNHGGIIIKLVGRSGKNLISTYFLKDMLGNVFDITSDLKAGRMNNVYRKAIETGASVAGYIGGTTLGKGITGGAIFAVGKLHGTSPEFATKRMSADVMAKQLLSEGKIILTRRGVYETGKGLSPRKDAWLDSKIKNPTKSIFWRFDKTLSPKDQAISPLPLFTKSKSGYFKMFKTNWNLNKGMSPVKRYIKTTAETPMIDDILIRRIVNLKNIKDLKLRRQIIKEYATKGKLSKATQDKVLKNNFPISDKNREFGFHDENEFVTRTGFKLKGRTDISWTFDPSINEYIPVVQNLKDTSRIKNFLSILNKKKIITGTDAKFIADNYAIKIKFGPKSILPKEHSYQHMKNVQDNIVKIMNKYPEFNSYWKKRYGSIAKAKEALKQAMWHDIGKGEPGSAAFGTPHGEKVWRVWKAGLLPKGIKLEKSVAKAIKVHETLDPRKLFFKVKNRIKLVTPEEKIVATADRLDLIRYGIKVDPTRLPLKDAITRLKIDAKFVKFPTSFKPIINKIMLDKKVTKSDLKKIFTFLKTESAKKIKDVSFRTPKWKSYTSTKYKDAYRLGWTSANRIGKKAPTNYNPKYKGIQSAYTEGYKEGYDGIYRINYKTGSYKRLVPRAVKRPPTRPTKRPPKRPTKRPPKRPTKRPPTRPTKRPPKRPVRRPPVRPPTKKKPPVVPKTLPKQFTRKTISKAQPVFYIKVKKKGRMVNLLPRPLILRDAKDYLAYKLDKNLVRTAYFEPIGRAKNVVRIPPKMRGYFKKVNHKLRPYRIRVGKKKLLRNGYIEKKRFVGDQPSEIKQLQAARRRKASKKTSSSKKRKAPVKKKTTKKKKK